MYDMFIMRKINIAFVICNQNKDLDKSKIILMMDTFKDLMKKKIVDSRQLLSTYT